METKVLSAIMKFQAAQIMLSTEGIYNNVSTHITDCGNLEISAYTHNPSEEATVIQILNTYTIGGAEVKEETYRKGKPDEFKTFTLRAFISDIED